MSENIEIEKRERPTALPPLTAFTRTQGTHAHWHTGTHVHRRHLPRLHLQWYAPRELTIVILDANRSRVGEVTGDWVYVRQTENWETNSPVCA